MKQLIQLILLICVVLIACQEQRALDRFDTAVRRLCMSARAGHNVDQHLSLHARGCVLVSIDQTLAAGLDEVGLEPGVYRTQGTNLGFAKYRDEVIVVRVLDTTDILAVMTPGAFHELVEAAGTVHEARLEEQQLSEGRGLVIFGNLQVFAPADPRPLNPDALFLLRKKLQDSSYS